MDNESLKPLNAGEIGKVDLLPQLKKVQSLIFKTCKYFFLGNLVMDNSPFKGFILIGPPGTKNRSC